MRYFNSCSILAIATAAAACGSKSTKNVEPGSNEVPAVTEPTAVETTESKTGEAELAQPNVSPEQKAEIGLDGQYYSESFHSKSPAVSRSLVIDGDKFTSKVVGIAPGTMNIIAIQEESGTLKPSEDGNGIDLVVEKSSCDNVPDFVAKTALKLTFKGLRLENDTLNFKFFSLDVESDGSLAKVAAIPQFAKTDLQAEHEACWYHDNGVFRAGIIKFLPAASASSQKFASTGVTF